MERESKKAKHEKHHKSSKEKKSKRKHDVDSNPSSSSEDEVERHQRKAAKKAEKVAKALGYTNDVNPFGDSNLMQPFVWGKKVEHAKSSGKDLAMSENGKRLELIEEIGKVRKRREDREKELEEMERLRNEEIRLREAAQYGDWQRKEEEFHLHQTKVRSKIRIADMREQPIDSLAKNIIMIESASKGKRDELKDKPLDITSLSVELRDPVSIVDGISDGEELGVLLSEVGSYYQLSVQHKDGYEKFWTCLQYIINRKRDIQRQQLTSSIHRSMQQEVDNLLAGKSDSQFQALEGDIRRGILDGKYPDVAYWENIANEIALHRAKNYVNQIHKQLLAKQLQILSTMKEELRASGRDIDNDDHHHSKHPRHHHATSSSSSSSSSSTSRAEQVALEEAAERTFGRSDESEEAMKSHDEVMLPGETYWWQDKYRPRKPRYFNKVRTGWEWNKYNSTHYDFDNPPPKMIQGYKFAIFYPDLIEKDKTPKYFLEPCEDKDYAILRFHAGPPYEDIAFKVLNKQWDVHRNSGFKCVFERGILQLHFNFRRQWYKR